MNSPPRYPDTDHDTGAGSDPESAASTSRWVYMVSIIGIGLRVLVVVLHLTGIMGYGLHGVH